MGFSKINLKLQAVVIAFFVLSAIPMIANAFPAFPGAQGWGSDTIGGRGGTVIKVTNLNDSGTGSLRAAMTASGPRYVIFTVGGTITLSSAIQVNNPYLTVAGQTAPGGGILIRGPNEPGGSGNATFKLASHDIIIRGLRMRDTGAASIDVLGPSTNTYNIIIDHNSMSWNTDTMTGMWGGYIHHVTWSYNSMSEGTDPTGRIGDSTKSAGFLGGMGSGYPCQSNHHITVHHNMIMHNDLRNPHVNYPFTHFEFINNYVYNWYDYGLGVASPMYIVGNHFQAGSSSRTNSDFFIGTLGGTCAFPTASVYLAHNINPHRPTDTGDEWNAVNGGSNSYRTNTPPYALSGVAEDGVTTVKSKLLASDGAGAIVPYRDAVDVRHVNEATNGTGVCGTNNAGGYYTSPTSFPCGGGWPTIASGTAPTDTDGDGMPDAWETLQWAWRLNPGAGCQQAAG